MSNSEQVCACPGPGYCPRWGKEVTSAGHRICSRGVARCIAMYFAPAPPGRALPVQGSGPCAYRGEPVRDVHGRQVTSECATCRGRVRMKVFACNHPAHAKDPTTTERACRACRDWAAEIVPEPIPFNETLFWLGAGVEMQPRPEANEQESTQ